MAASATKELLVRILGDDTKLTKTVGRLDASFGRIQKRAGAFAKSASRQFVGVTAAVTGVAYAMNRLFLQPFGIQQEAVESLRAALTATGKDGEASLALLTDEASRLQGITTAADEALIKASATLATLAPSLDVNSLRSAQTALVAIADTFLKGDVENAAQLLGKTLGSTTNALTRYGITISDTAAPASEKLAEIMGSKTLGTAFDVAQAKAKTMTGRITQLKNAVGDLQEGFGSILAEIFGVTVESEGLIGTVQAMTVGLEENRTKWVNWGRVTISVLNLVKEIAVGMARVVGNVFTIVYHSAMAMTALMRGGIREARDHFQDIKKDLGDLDDTGWNVAEAMVKVDDAFYNLYRGLPPVQKETKKTKTEVELMAGALDGPGTGEKPSLVRALDNVAMAADRVVPKLTLPPIVREKITQLHNDVVYLGLAFSDALADSLFEGMNAFKAFADYAIRQILRVAASFLVFQAIKGIFGALNPFTLAFGAASGFLSSGQQSYMSIPTATTGMTTSGAAFSGAIAPSVSFSFDMSKMPAPVSPFDMARDAQWVDFLGKSLSEWQRNGGRFRTGG